MFNNAAFADIKDDVSISQSYKSARIKSKMSINQKKKALEKLMKSYPFYDDFDINRFISKKIDWQNLNEDFSPSFYKAISHKYFYDYILYNDDLELDFTNENIMFQFSKLIETMLQNDCEPYDIKRIINKHIDWQKAGRENLPDSFYAALTNDRIHFLTESNVVLTDKSQMLEFFEFLKTAEKYGYSKKEIENFVSKLDFSSLTNDEYKNVCYSILADKKYMNLLFLNQYNKNTVQDIFKDKKNLIGVLKFIYFMKMHKYSDEQTDKLLTNLVIPISQDNRELPPSFYNALEKRYLLINKASDIYFRNNYKLYSDENMMEYYVKAMDLIKENNFSDVKAFAIVSQIRWDKITKESLPNLSKIYDLGFSLEAVKADELNDKAVKSLETNKIIKQDLENIEPDVIKAVLNSSDISDNKKISTMKNIQNYLNHRKYWSKDNAVPTASMTAFTGPGVVFLPVMALSFVASEIVFQPKFIKARRDMKRVGLEQNKGKLQ